jgi:hypothetical protein
MNLNFKSFGLLILLITGMSAGAFAPQANAYEYWNHGYRGGGHWIHDRHDGRLGWWWVAGATWAFYPRPYPVYPPQTVVIQQVPVQAYPPAAPQVVMQPAPQVIAQAPPVLYYCKSTETYYPDTMTCPGGWSTMVAGAPPTAPMNVGK